ncbi:MAG: hypothetical protein NVS4B11_17570 [Ktedonobacteraceae bacterium]
MSTTKQTSDTQDIEKILEQLSKDDLFSLIKQMIQLHPDVTELITAVQPTAPTKQQRAPFNAELYRLKIDKIFYSTDRTTWGSEGRAADPLLDIKEVGDNYLQQKDYADAATLYELIIRGILDNYDSFNWHADEGDLDEVVQDCVDDLGKCLLGERSNTAVRKQIIQTLYDVYVFDISMDYNDEPVLSSKIRPILTRYTTPEERKVVAGLLRKKFKLAINWSSDTIAEDDNEVLLLGLEADTIDDETFLTISRESESYSYVVERLLQLERLEEALAEAEHVENYDILEIADILTEYKHEATAEHLIEERVKKSNDTDLLHWLQASYETRGNVAGALEMAYRSFRTSPYAATIERYREIRQLAKKLKRWDTMQSEVIEYLKQSHNTTLQIEITLDEKQIERALELLQAEQQTEGPSKRPYGSVRSDVVIEVAKAAEKSHPQEAIEIYQKSVAALIEQRGRENYHTASQYLKSVRTLYTRIGKSDEWTNYIETVREQNRKLPALKDEMAKAKL